MSIAYDKMVMLLEQFIDQPDMVPIIAAVNAYCHAATLAERERVERLLLDLYERGPQRGAIGWAQAWGSGVLDAADAIREAPLDEAW